MIKKIYLSALILVSGLLLAGPGGGPPGGPGGGGGSVGPGAKAKAPIDMYVYVLAIIAIFAIWYYAKKYKTQLK